MELALVVDINDHAAVKNVIELCRTYNISAILKVDSRSCFNNSLDDVAELLSDNFEFFVGLHGPSRNIDGSTTLFEDTVYVATQLEDLFNIEFDTITTPEVRGSSHIIELADFFNSQLQLNVIPMNNIADKNGYTDPITAAIMLEHIHIVSGYPGINMCFDASRTPTAYMLKEVFSPLVRYIDEISFSLTSRYPFNLDTNFNWLKNVGTITDYNFLVSVHFPSYEYSMGLLVPKMIDEINKFIVECGEQPAVEGP